MVTQQEHTWGTARGGWGGLKDDWIKGKQEVYLVRPWPNIPSNHCSNQPCPFHQMLCSSPFLPYDPCSPTFYQSSGTHLPSAMDYDFLHPQHLHWHHAVKSHKGKQHRTWCYHSHPIPIVGSPTSRLLWGGVKGPWLCSTARQAQ